MPAPLLVFDLDGTLADTAPDLLSTLSAVLSRRGHPVEVDASFRDGIGHGARYLVEYALKRQGLRFDVPTLDALHADFIQHYRENISVGTRLFPGTEALLDRFETAGWKFAVCTNKPEGLSRLLLGNLGVAGRFVAICGGDTFRSRKPDPLHLLETIAASSCAPEGSIMVGDSRTDLDTARAAGIPMIGVTFGYTPVPMIELKPDALVRHFDEVTVDFADRLVTQAAAPRDEALAASVP